MTDKQLTIEQAAKLAYELSRSGHAIPKPVTSEALAGMVAKGMLPKADLEHGAYYIGSCRNAPVARWNEPKGVFQHLREKLDRVFMEDINHPEDDDGFDLFVPTLKIELGEWWGP